MLLPSSISSKLSWFHRYYYFISVFTAGLLVVSAGCVVAWPSPTMHRFRTGQTSLQGGQDDVTGVGYVFFIGCIPGLLVTWLFLTYVGRRAGMLAAALLYAISWVAMSLATTLSWVYGARLLQGVAQTIALTIPSVYVVEISPVAWREVSGFSLQFFFNTGLLLQYSVGPFVSYWTLIYINLSVALLFFFPFLLVSHETPYFLLMKNDEEKAQQVLAQFRNHVQPPDHQAVQQELLLIKNLLEEKEKCSVLTKFKMLLSERASRRALLIVVGLTYQFVFSGLSQLLMFAETLFRIAEVEISASISCIFIGIVKLVGSFALPFLVKRFGIKKMSIYSTLVCGIAMMLLALFYTLKSQGYALKQLFWAPLFLLLLYFFLSAIGLSFMVIHARAEMFRPQLKSTGIMVQEMVNLVMLELCSLLLTQLLHRVYIPLWIFSISMLISVVFMLHCLPHSTSMSLNELQQWLSR